MKRAFLFAMMFLFISTGCAVKEEVKLSEESVTARNAISAVDAIKDAFIKKDRDAIHEKVESALSDEILNGLTFDSVDLSYTVRMIKISALKVMVHLNWHGTWMSGGNEARDRGVAILVFNKDTMKLNQVDGDNPFSAR
jgi:hypothetical protein